jgi:hypothetical protein
MDSMQKKEKLIQNLKGSMSQDKFKRKKIISDNDNSHSIDKDVYNMGTHSFIDKPINLINNHEDKSRKTNFVYNINLFSHAKNKKGMKKYVIYIIL